MPVTKPYRKQLTSQPLPQVTPQSAGNFLRQTAKQQENLAAQTYKRSMEIYDNTFDIMLHQKVKEVYDQNKNNPTGFEKSIKEIELELLKPVKNTNKKQEFALKLGIYAAPFKEKAQALFNRQQVEELQATSLKRIDEIIQAQEDTAQLLFGDPNSQATVKYGLSYGLARTDYINFLQQKDDEGNFIFSPAMQQQSIERFDTNTLSAGTRGYFDNASIADKYKFYNQYRNKQATILVPDAKSKTGFSSQAVDKFVDRQTFERDRAYMERTINEYEVLLKKGRKEKEAEALALKKMQTLTELEYRLANFEIEKGVPQKNNDLDTMLEFNNAVDNAMVNGYITANRAATFKGKIAEGILGAIDEIKLESGHEDRRIFQENVRSTMLTGTDAINQIVKEIEFTEDPFKEVKATEDLPEKIFGMTETERQKLQKTIRRIEQKKPVLTTLGLTEDEIKTLKKETRDIEAGYQILRLNLTTAYLNRLKEANIDPKSMAKEDIEKSRIVLSKILKTYAMKSNPLLMFEEDVVNKSLENMGYKPVDQTPPKKLMNKKIGIPKGYELYQDNKTGRQVLIKKNTR